MTHPPETIHAAYHLTIELEPNRWRLYNGAAESAEAAQPLLDAQPGGIICSPLFARARRLSEDGRLELTRVARVVVGWAPESRNWHLGLMLYPEKEGGRLRWCGLAHWPSGPAAEHEKTAVTAGRALADVIGRPFHVVPPKQSAPVEPEPPAPAPEPAPPPFIPLDEPLAPEPVSAEASPAALNDVPVLPAGSPAVVPPVTVAPISPTPFGVPGVAPEPLVAQQNPPFNFEEWQMVATRRGYGFQRPARWLIMLMLRAGGYTVGALLFVMLGIGSLESELAQVNPEWLPYVGIGVGVILGALALLLWWRVLTVQDVVIDTQQREIRCRNRLSGSVRWRLPFDAVEYVLLSQTPARVYGRKKPDRPVPIMCDAWLHVYDGGRFWPIVELARVEGKSHVWLLVERLQAQRGRRVLDLAHYDTPAHHAALTLAGALGAGVWVDVR